MQIGNLIFPTKKTAKDFVREIISRHAAKSSLAAEDFSFVSDLLAIHPESEQKIGCGISRIFVDFDAQYHRNKCFYLERHDGSSTDFSWVSCIDGRNIRRETFDAFRNAVTDQIDSFKSKQLLAGIFCPYTSESLHNGNCHVDHESPLTFYNLVNNFIAEKSISILDVKISAPEDNQFTANLIDKNFIEQWQKYHLKTAKLRVISQTGNLSHAKKS
jgi:hypothetical protein